MDAPFFSIIIPSRNRYSTLQHTLRTVLNQDFTDFEVVLSDNSDPENLEQVSKIDEQLKDSRIRYLRPPNVLSMTDNWEFGVSAARGKYLIIFGDDDGVVDGALGKLFSILQDTGAELVSWSRIEYSWPDRIPNELGNMMTIPYMARTGTIDSKTYINKVIRCRADYRDLPMFYNSAVNRDLVDRLRQKAGRVFNAFSPDLYTGYAFAHLLGKYITIGYPLTINGVSATSNGAAHVNEDETRMADYWRLLKQSAIKWPSILPEVNTPYIAIVEPFVQLTRFMPELNKYISKKRIYKTIVDSTEGGSSQNVELKMKRILEGAGDDQALGRWLKGYIQKARPRIVGNTPLEVKTGFVGSYLVLDGSKFGLQNVYDVSLFIKNLFGDLKDTDYFKPAIPAGMKRLKKAAALAVRGI
jgi:glycosyltransferase involved in cell wall biosynthesis